MKTLKSLIKYSKHNSLEYLQGYICGLVCSPYEYNLDKLLKQLFNALTPKQKDDIQSVIDYSVIKLNTDFEFGVFKLPKKCVLSVKDYKESLQPNTPLVDWCNGALQGLKQINKSKLKKDQKQILTELENELITFTSLENAQHQLVNSGEMFERFLYDKKRSLSTQIHNLRFELDELECLSQEDFFDDEEEFLDFMTELDEEPDEFEELLNNILLDTNITVIPLINDMIADIERIQITKEFIEQNTGVFWLMEETRSYMLLCAHRAYVLAKHKQYDPAIEQMQTLLKLNPNDNQGVRYTLTNLLCITKNWDTQIQLEQDFPDEFINFTATKALRLFAQQGDSKAAQKIKKQLKSENKHFMKILTGQEKVAELNEYFQPGDKSEVSMYLDCFGKEAWLANEGSLFWLRKK
ncbi:UPF0149 family protein [Pseudoalteromonas denitrificans]|uniref:Uncharacterized protein family (UPF0149) n=1 Tax=Pseudoalteromonas denitrificans DSM 6059 TaxID=1123010 RepID=A0A1I1TTE9_9GAMM|nr:UPF0149 family protein [Pseudoalteromonas denitrificans]SFD61655.1 Uncharacterised protein family (UPF0149) [Pseudoalteromonas denitrificans DSM 6059]